MKIGGKLLERKTGGRSRYWQVFWLCFAVAAALFLPHCIIDGLNGNRLCGGARALFGHGTWGRDGRHDKPSYA